MRCSPMKETRSGRPSSHVPIRAERSTPYGRTLPLGRHPTRGGVRRSRNETVRPRDRARSRPLQQRPLNRKTPSDRLAPPTIPQQAADHPNQPIEGGDHDSQTSHKNDDARIDDEPFHHEAHGTSASVTTTREPMLGPHAARVVERARKRDAIAESHFDLTFHVGWVG